MGETRAPPHRIYAKVFDYIAQHQAKCLPLLKYSVSVSDNDYDKSETSCSSQTQDDPRCKQDTLRKHDSFKSAFSPKGSEPFLVPDMTWIQMGGELWEQEREPAH